ncbi:hypothetical protein T439DRAFT_171681 [Meredithblackwellia eburnea MCA 4105]
MIALNPKEFGVKPFNSRTLELGAGTGLLSLVWKAMCDRAIADSDKEPSEPGDGAAAGEKRQPAVILATDYHQTVLSNLRKNVDDNAVKTPQSLTERGDDDDEDEDDAARRWRTCDEANLSVHKLDWSAVHGSRSFALSARNSLVMPALPSPRTPLPTHHQPRPLPFDRSTPERLPTRPETQIGRTYRSSPAKPRRSTSSSRFARLTRLRLLVLQRCFLWLKISLHPGERGTGRSRFRACRR